jgi:hypothetical protein
MTHSTGNAYAEGWNLHSNGYAELIQDFAGGWQYVTVTAAGQYAYGSWPHLRVTVGGGQVFETFVEFPSWTEYSFWVNRPPGVAPVRVYHSRCSCRRAVTVGSVRDARAP